MYEIETLKDLLTETRSLKMQLMKDFSDIKYLLTKIEKNTAPITIPADSGVRVLKGKTP